MLQPSLNTYSLLQTVSFLRGQTVRVRHHPYAIYLFTTWSVEKDRHRECWSHREWPNVHYLCRHFWSLLLPPETLYQANGNPYSLRTRVLISNLIVNLKTYNLVYDCSVYLMFVLKNVINIYYTFLSLTLQKPLQIFKHRLRLRISARPRMPKHYAAAVVFVAVAPGQVVDASMNMRKNGFV